MSPVEIVLSKLTDPKRSGRGWQARCPAHDDKRPSLSVSEGRDGRVLVFCYAGCSAEAIVEALGMTVRDLMPVDARTVDNTHPGRPQNKVLSASTPKNAPNTYATARDAVAELERRHGTRAAMWTYRDIEGQPVGAVVRFEGSNGKTIRPVAHTGSGWIIGAMPAPRPVYLLPELLRRASERIYITEGEKAADAVAELELLATTSAGGSKAARKTDWTPLAGRRVTILPDNDAPGRGYAEGLAAILAKLTPAPSVRVVELPDLPPGCDAVEFVEARHAAGLDEDAIRAELESLADAAEPIEIGRPTPAVETYRAFPVEALPEPVRAFVAEGARAIGCDPSYIALPTLAGLAAAIGNTRRVELKRGWTEPPIIWAAIIGASGTLKTPAFKLAMQSIRIRQAEALKRHADELAAFGIEVLQYEKALAAWKRAKPDNGDPPEKPVRPEAERFVVSDTTVEALAPILLANPRGVLLARDELGGWLGSFDRYAAGGRGGADVAHWLSMYGGEALIVDRKTGPARTAFVPSAAVCVVGGIQPGRLDRAIGFEHRESGLLARLWLAWPPRKRKRWTEATIPRGTEAAIERVFERLYELKANHDPSGDPIPVIVPLSSTGKAAWIAFYGEHAGEQAESTGDVAAAMSKLEGGAARLALVVHFVRWAAGDPTLADPDAVDAESIGAGVAMAQWFGREARRVYAVLSETDEARDQRRLVELIQGKGGTVSVRDWQRAGSHRTSSEAEAELAELAEAGYGHWVLPAPGPKGGRPAKHFVLTPDTSDTDKTPASDADAPVSSVSGTSEAPDSTHEDAEGTDAGSDDWGEI